jgi:hypothetical protein
MIAVIYFIGVPTVLVPFFVQYCTAQYITILLYYCNTCTHTGTCTGRLAEWLEESSLHDKNFAEYAIIKDAKKQLIYHAENLFLPHLNDGET